MSAGQYNYFQDGVESYTVTLPQNDRVVQQANRNIHDGDDSLKKKVDYCNLLAASTEKALLDDIYSDGAPSPKHKPEPTLAKPQPVIPQVVPIEIDVEVPAKAAAEPIAQQEKVVTVIEDPEEDNQSSSSRFSKSSTHSRKPNEKEILRQKLDQLREKLKKAKSEKEKVQIVEKQRDRDLLEQRKAEAKAKQKREEFEKKQESRLSQKQERRSSQKQESNQSQEKNQHTRAEPKIAAPKAQKETPVKKREPVAVRPAQTKTHDLAQEHGSFNSKLHLVDEFATRWWYAMPEWPPADFDFNQALRNQNLELVEPNKLREESKQKRVCGVEGYEGVYRDAAGVLYDLRPKDSMPCLQNFQKKSVAELQQLLKQAYSAQLSQLQEMRDGNQPSYDREIEAQLYSSLQSKLKSLSSYI